ncbi:MAG: hypothetical protein PHS17_14980, partial [Desulfobacterales bacterium]|nr:hypothetical protein [Desulfobacterales bacterium]
NHSAAEAKSSTTYAKTEYVDLKVTKDKPQVDVLVRLVGFPVEYLEHTPYKRVEGEDQPKPEAFPDDEFYGRQTWSRICWEDPLTGIDPPKKEES